MDNRKKILLRAAGFGGGFAIIGAAIVALALWWSSRPVKPKPLNTDAISGRDSTRLYECDANMSDSACAQKTQADLASAIRNCHFEPDWRPSHLEESNLHVDKVDGMNVAISIEGKHYSLQNGSDSESGCRDVGGKSCSPWKPEGGNSYPATVTVEPEYLNSCLHRVLRAERDVCIGFGKITEKQYPRGTSRESEFSTCFELPPN
jgi:hypothetical protein